VLNKLDLIPEEERAERIRAFLDAYGSDAPHFGISAINGQGCRALTYALQDALDTLAPLPPVDDTSADAFFPDDPETDGQRS